MSSKLVSYSLTNKHFKLFKPFTNVFIIKLKLVKKKLIFCHCIILFLKINLWNYCFYLYRNVLFKILNNGYSERENFVVNLGCYYITHLSVSTFFKKVGRGWGKGHGWWVQLYLPVERNIYQRRRKSVIISTDSISMCIINQR